MVGVCGDCGGAAGVCALEGTVAECGADECAVAGSCSSECAGVECGVGGCVVVESWAG